MPGKAAAVLSGQDLEAQTAAIGHKAVELEDFDKWQELYFGL